MHSFCHWSPHSINFTPAVQDCTFAFARTPQNLAAQWRRSLALALSCSFGTRMKWQYGTLNLQLRNRHRKRLCGDRCWGGPVSLAMSCRRLRHRGDAVCRALRCPTRRFTRRPPTRETTLMYSSSLTQERERFARSTITESTNWAHFSRPGMPVQAFIRLNRLAMAAEMLG